MGQQRQSDAVDMSVQAESCEEEGNEDKERGESNLGGTLIDSNTRGKENLDENVLDQEKSNDEFFCHQCKRSLAGSPELINIAGLPYRRWHPNCFRCIICREPMDKRQSCHVYEDQIVCRADYMRLKRDIISVKCARCCWPIGASDWVRKAAQHVYHLTCFNCDICSRQLNTGEQFILSPADSSRGDESGVRLLCRLHFTIDHERRRPDQDSATREPAPPLKVARANQGEEEEQDRTASDTRRQTNKRTFFCSQLAPSTSSGGGGGGEGTSIIIAQPNHNSQEHPGFQFGPDISMGKDLSIVTSHSHQHCPSSANTSPSATSSSNTTTLLGCGSSELGGPTTPTGDQSGCGSGSGSPSKSKRVRTTFTEDQLSILQTHFQIDSNPDGQDLERIATITGLSKRVTQVWFQNSRARQKKYMIKRKPMHTMATLQDHTHHTLELVGSRIGDEDDNDESSNQLRTFDELTRFHRRGELFVAGLEQLQRRCEVLNEQTSWRAGAGHKGGQVDEDRVSGISSLSSEPDVTQGCGDDSNSPSANKPESTPKEGQSNN